MIGLLADVNIQGEFADLRTALNADGLTPLLEAVGLRLYTYPDFGLDPGMDDRRLWQFCQQQRLALFTDNRNSDDQDSLQATMLDSLRPDSLPVLTPGDKGRFHSSTDYQIRVARSVAEIMYSLRHDATYLGVGRLFVPLPRYT